MHSETPSRWSSVHLELLDDCALPKIQGRVRLRAKNVAKSPLSAHISACGASGFCFYAVQLSPLVGRNAFVILDTLSSYNAVRVVL